MLTQNIRVKALFRTTEYLTALKEIMVATKAFDDLAMYVEDSDTLMLILLVNLYKVDLDLKFKNPTFGKEERETTMQIIGILA